MVLPVIDSPVETADTTVPRLRDLILVCRRRVHVGSREVSTSGAVAVAVAVDVACICNCDLNTQS